MNRYIQALGLVFLMNGGFSYIVAAPSAAGQNAFATYDIQISGYGDDALVQAIQQYSNITKADVDRWKYSWAPFLGSYVRGGVMDKIRNFVIVCNSLDFIPRKFQSGDDLMGNVKDANWTYQRICLALRNLENQGEYALALFGKFGTIGQQEQQLKYAINEYIKNIRHNRLILGCSNLKEQKKDKEVKKLKEEENKLKYNKLWWQNMQLRWKVAKDVGANVFKGTKWLVQTAHEYSAPLLSAGAVWFAYNKLFGLPQTVPAK